MSTEQKLAEARSGKRPAKTGMVRVVVSIPEHVHKALEEKAVEESAAFPRPVNEMLSILIEKKWELLVADAADDSNDMSKTGSESDK